MIINLFPVSIYIDKNASIVINGMNLFNAWTKQPEQYYESNFVTTLSDYSNLGTGTAYDLISTRDGKILTEFIKQSTINYLKENMQKTNYDVIVNNLWLNEMTSGSAHLKHNHSGYTLSGTFYVEVPEPSNKIEFYNLVDDIGLQKVLDAEEWTPSNSANWWIPVESGTIVIFPAYLKHSVPKEEFKGSRKSIAFDITLMEK